MSITYPPEMLPKAGEDEEAEVIVVDPNTGKRRVVTEPPELTVFPIPIRSDVIVRIHLPHDLTKKEAERICRVVMAFCVTDGAL